MVAVAKITELATELCNRAPFLRGIRNDDEHEQALAMMEELIEDYDANLVVIEALSTLIARYEEDATSFSAFNSRVSELDPAVATLRVIMDQRQLKTNDFQNEIGGKSLVSQILNGGKRLTRNHIERLAKRFNISPALFFN